MSEILWWKVINRRTLAFFTAGEKLVQHRRKFYHVGYADYDKDYRERISFLPPESCIEAWRADYDELLMHFVYGNKLSFDELLERVSELNKRFNGEDYK